MKKQLFIRSLLCLFYLQQVQAQTPQYPAHNILSLLHTTAQKNQSPTANKPTGTGKLRLTAECAFTNNGIEFVPVDSGVCVYTGNRGSVDLTTNAKYDQATLYAYNTTNNAYQNGELVVQTFDTKDNAITTTTKAWDIPSNAYVNYQNFINTYDGNNNLLTQIKQNWVAATSSWVNSVKQTYTYDNNSNMLTQIVQDWDPINKAWTNDTKNIKTYNAANKEAEETDQIWAGAAWANYGQWQYVYDANNNLTNSIGSGWDQVNNIWELEGQGIYTYDAMNNMLTQLQQSRVKNSWLNITLTTYSNFVDQLPQITIDQSWDTLSKGWINANKTLDTYNSYDAKTMETTQTWNVGANFWQATVGNVLSRFYYETYALDVKALSNAGGSAHIYPVPAQDVLHIDLVWDEPQACHIAIYDVQGRTLKQWQLPATKDYHNAISVNDLATGNYFIKITGLQGQIVQKLIISN